MKVLIKANGLEAALRRMLTAVSSDALQHACMLVAHIACFARTYAECVFISNHLYHYFFLIIKKKKTVFVCLLTYDTLC